MSKKEATPFVIDFKQTGSTSSYGTTTSTPSAPSSSSAAMLNNNNEDVQPPHTPTLYCLHGRNKIEVRDHCHRQRSEGVDVKARRKLIIASCLCLFFMICEIVGGVLSNSLAIATDAAHLLTDFASFMISLFAIWIAGRPSTQRMSFGWYRAEVIGAMASVVMIWVITGILVYLAVQRVISQQFEVDAVIMLITSGLAIVVNLIMGFQLQHGHSHGGGASHGHSHGGGAAKKKSKKPAALNGLSLTSRSKPQENGHGAPEAICPTPPTRRLEDGVDTGAVDAEMPASGLATFSYQNSRSLSVHSEIAAVMAETAPGAHHHGGTAGREAVNMNVRAAYIHVVGDIVQSVGVFLAALLIYFKPEWAIADPICTFVFSIIVLYTTISIMKDAMLVLMEGTPAYLDYSEVHDVFRQINGVKKVHNLRIWALSINKIALSAHLAVDKDVDPKRILEEANRVVHMRYNFFETTIQIEEFTPQMEECQQCELPYE